MESRTSGHRLRVLGGFWDLVFEHVARGSNSPPYTMPGLLGPAPSQVDGEFYHAVNPDSTVVKLYKKLQAHGIDSGC